MEISATYQEVKETREGHQGHEMHWHQRHQDPKSGKSAHPQQPNRTLHETARTHKPPSETHAQTHWWSMARTHKAAHMSPLLQNQFL